MLVGQELATLQIGYAVGWVRVLASLPMVLVGVLASLLIVRVRVLARVFKADSRRGQTDIEESSTKLDRICQLPDAQLAADPRTME